MASRILPLVLLGLALARAGWAAGGPPVADTLTVSVCALNAVSVEPAGVTHSARPLKADRKALPKSVQPFLRPSGLIDSQKAPVVKAARQAAKGLGAAGSKDGGRVLSAVLAWLDHRPPKAAASPRAATDWRAGWSKASQLASQPALAPEERTRLGVAMLRALGVPARPCLVDGRPRIQAFMQYAKSKPGKRRGKKTGPAIKGFWAVEGPLAEGQAVDGWALDSGELARVEWQPQQELTVALAGVERRYFSQQDEPAARAAFAQLTATGRLPEGAGAAAPPSQGKWLAVACERWTVQAQGALQPLSYLALMAPYLPHQADWGAEEEPPLRQDTLACGLFTDRPGRVSVPTAWAEGDWNRAKERSVQGALHLLPCRVRRPADLLQAGWQADGTISGVALRADNLSPLAGQTITAQALGDSLAARAETAVDAHGVFKLALPAAPSAWAFRLECGAAGRSDALLIGKPQ